MLAATLALAGTSVHAAECLPRVESAWVRLPPVAMPMMAGFATLSNPCETPLQVVSASSPAFADVSIHQSTVVDGINRMREVDVLEIPAGGSVELKPGSYHLMLMQPKTAPKAGDKVSIVLKLQDGRELPASFQVRANPNAS
ncbi:hypothetical protein ABB29_11175 [Pseudoxanthomonas dokdonensis]|uniref:Copper chaperone PCu(A)C n=1 Tax=Pseudoxanthomonas dokdonensis TaxID=344882 RepID=A0A0R0CS00_9GAMM|nr:hypothetical protein ABB29_11175 [Pseudoxanthomonas dokdonensis]